jgi:hypothetical protein
LDLYLHDLYPALELLAPLFFTLKQQSLKEGSYLLFVELFLGLLGFLVLPLVFFDELFAFV